jgi:hypothetical protein
MGPPEEKNWGMVSHGHSIVSSQLTRDGFVDGRRSS